MPPEVGVRGEEATSQGGVQSARTGIAECTAVVGPALTAAWAETAHGVCRSAQRRQPPSWRTSQRTIAQGFLVASHSASVIGSLRLPHALPTQPVRRPDPFTSPRAGQRGKGNHVPSRRRLARVEIGEGDVAVALRRRGPSAALLPRLGVPAQLTQRLAELLDGERLAQDAGDPPLFHVLHGVIFARHQTAGQTWSEQPQSGPRLRPKSPLSGDPRNLLFHRAASEDRISEGGCFQIPSSAKVRATRRPPAASQAGQCSPQTRLRGLNRQRSTPCQRSETFLPSRAAR